MLAAADPNQGQVLLSEPSHALQGVDLVQPEVVRILGELERAEPVVNRLLLPELELLVVAVVVVQLLLLPLDSSCFMIG